jgi:hypothetical protein
MLGKSYYAKTALLEKRAYPVDKYEESEFACNISYKKFS